VRFHQPSTNDSGTGSVRALVIDDETAARERLRRLLQDLPQVEIIGEAKNGLAAVQQIEALNPDVIFLDIQMPGIDGFQVLRELSDPFQIPLVIFATGFEQHALRAFKENALGYLLKPIDPDQLRTAVNRAERLLRSDRERLEEKARAQRAAKGAQTLNSIIGRKHNTYFLLKQDEVLWFVIVDGIVKARTASDQFSLNHQFGELEESLQNSNFFRARRDVLVNLNHVRVIRPYDRSTYALEMTDDQKTEFIVSERQARLLRERLPGL